VAVALGQPYRDIAPSGCPLFSFTCEFISEESMALCSGPAGYQINERYVEDHLCEQHGQTEALSLADGLMGNMHLIRLSEGETLRGFRAVVAGPV
jgi:hypothetical protein